MTGMWEEVEEIFAQKWEKTGEFPSTLLEKRNEKITFKTRRDSIANL